MDEIETMVSVDELAQMRRDGLSYQKIGKQLGVSVNKVCSYAKEVLPPELAGRLSTLGRVNRLLAEVDDGTRPAREVALEVGCSVNAVYQSRRDRGIKSQLTRSQAGCRAYALRATRPRCQRCGTFGWDRNPLLGDVCLWCRADQLGIHLRDAFERWGFEAVVKALREA